MKSKKPLSYVTPALLLVTGCVGGYLYYRFIGCESGSCAITSSPYISTVYGGIIGLLLGLIIAPTDRKKVNGRLPDESEGR